MESSMKDIFPMKWSTKPKISSEKIAKIFSPSDSTYTLPKSFYGLLH